MSGYWMPRAMCVAPQLDQALRVPAVTRRHALPINPFYPKDPHASFGKHVLTPSLALTSIAAARLSCQTASHYARAKARFWGNLLPPRERGDIFEWQ